MKKAIVFISAAFIFFAHFAAYADEPAPGYKPPIVRVAVIKGVKDLILSVRGKVQIRPFQSDDILYEADSLAKSEASAQSWGVKIADMDFKFYGIRIIPSNEATIDIGKRSFRGEVDIIRQKDETLLVVNHIIVEDYLKGVLYHEVSHWWPIAVLEAQAIASRSFALYQAAANKNRDYDLETDVYSQVYGGATSERYRTNKAVVNTAGKVLMYKDKILPAYFHATCAGHTEDASVLWKTDLTPLKGVICGFCNRSPHFHWKKRILVKDIQKAIGIKNIKSILPKKFDSSGRIVALDIQTSEGKITEYSAKDFRQKLGGNTIKSAIFTVSIRLKRGKKYAYFEGAGWGHGVGMCQWGAFGMARKGHNAQDILKHYYPGADIEIYAE